MKDINRNKWEISLLKINFEKKAVYKVTKRFPLEGIQETKMFSDLKKARKQKEKWKKEHLR